ncbi:MAG: hypothetical protein A2Y10_14745 [Planctomycetes bacterium GWF2_41_51]|nr:MAG: hypothetical protein A2Y10_14745 [Planctomycetes bacterium GWF2_41_51]HBG29000.1 hypothetical protein [Phycisphaerales bacterium]
MNNTQSKRKNRSDKFPLTLHKTGQYCKKIRGKIYYFGSDKALAYKRYLEQATYLHSHKSNNEKCSCEDVSIKHLCNMYIEHQQSRALIGQIKFRHVYDQTLILKDFVRLIGPNKLINDIATMDIQQYVRKAVHSKKTANTVNNKIAVIKSLYNWAQENELINKGPNLKAVKKITKIKKEQFIFQFEQIQKLLSVADIQIKAMILLGLNCGFGCTDCAELKWENLDLEHNRVVYPRGKTGISRNLILWSETVSALKDVPKRGELVFYTTKGLFWVRANTKTDESGVEKLSKENAVSKQFSKLLKKTGIKVEKGVGFYTLRRTAATMAARSGDPFAVQKLLGHADLKMATTYVQDVSEQTDRVVNNMRKFIIPDGSLPSADSADGDGK